LYRCFCQTWFEEQGRNDEGRAACGTRDHKERDQEQSVEDQSDAAPLGFATIGVACTALMA